MPEHITQLLRGRMLRDHGRYEEAEAFFREAITGDPDDADSYAELALCLMSMEGRRKDALGIIEEAIARQPDNDWFHNLRALILSKLKRGKEALESAARAIAINPDSALHYTAQADAHATMSRWAEAEQSARRALALDSDNEFASNLLAHVLRVQGKQGESEIATGQLLAKNPEDPYAHYNAGMSALQAGDSPKAENHFLEALRLDPGFDAARDGLLESFKARSAFYRLYLRYGFWMARFTDGQRWLFIIGLYVAYQIANTALKKVAPIAAGVLVTTYLLFVCWVWLAPGIGSLLVMMDKSARHALKTEEKIEASTVGGGLVIAAMAFALGIIFAHFPSLVLAVMILASTIPASLAFTNEQPKGRRLFGGVYFSCLIAGITAFIVESSRHTTGLDGLHGGIENFLLITFIAAVGCTWLGNIPSLRERSD